MTLTADEIEFLRREAKITNNTFSCADMLPVLDALVNEQAMHARLKVDAARLIANLDDSERERESAERERDEARAQIEEMATEYRNGCDGRVLDADARRKAEARAEKAEASAAVTREAIGALLARFPVGGALSDGLIREETDGLRAALATNVEVTKP